MDSWGGLLPLWGPMSFLKHRSIGCNAIYFLSLTPTTMMTYSTSSFIAAAADFVEFGLSLDQDFFEG